MSIDETNDVDDESDDATITNSNNDIDTRSTSSDDSL